MTMEDTDRGLICDKIIGLLEEALGPEKANKVGLLLYDLVEEGRAQAVAYIKDLEIYDALVPVKEALAEHRHLSTGEASITLREVIKKWFK